MSLYTSLLSSAPIKSQIRSIPTGLLLLDKMITGVPLGGITLLLGDCKEAVLSFMKNVVTQSYDVMPSKYTGGVDFNINDKREVYWLFNSKTFPELLKELKEFADDNHPVFCLFAHVASIDAHMPASNELDQLQRRFSNKVGNGLVLYLDEQSGVPRSLIDGLIMRASTVLKFSEISEKCDPSVGYVPSGAQITVIKRPLSLSPIRTALFPLVNGALSDSMSVFYYLLDQKEIFQCGYDNGQVYYCGTGLELKKFTEEEWKDSFVDLRHLLLRHIKN